MKKIISLVLVCVLLVGCMFTLASCSTILMGKYEAKGLFGTTTLEFNLDGTMTYTKGSISLNGTYEIEKDDNGNSIGAGIYYQGGSGGQAFYDAMVRLGSTNAVFCGHDHINTMRGLTDDNVLLAYGRCCGYHTYPFFETQKNTLMEKLMHSIFGNEGAAMYLDQWVDEDGNVIGKGVSIIEVDLTQDNYGSLRMYDISHKSLQEGTFVVENEITIGG